MNLWTWSSNPLRFDPNAWRGKQAATVWIRPSEGRSLEGETYRVSYSLQNYGRLRVAEGKLGGDGKIALADIAVTGVSRGEGQYEVEVGGQYLGRFSVEEKRGTQEFSFHMPLGVGDRAVAGEAEDLETGQPVRISDLRGRVVLLEFWATWCGPCQEPMKHLDELVSVGVRNGETMWRSSPSVSITTVRRCGERSSRAGSRTSSNSGALRSSREAGSACGVYSVWEVPATYLIDRDARIVWTGHPSSLDLERKIEELLTRAYRP